MHWIVKGEESICEVSLQKNDNGDIELIMTVGESEYCILRLHRYNRQIELCDPPPPDVLAPVKKANGEYRARVVDAGTYEELR